MEKYIFYIHNDEIIFKEYYKKVDSNNKYYNIFQSIILNISNFGLNLINFLEILCNQNFPIRKKIIMNIEYIEFNTLFNDDKCFEVNLSDNLVIYNKIKLNKEKTLEVYNLYNLINCAKTLNKKFEENFSRFLIRNNLRLENFGMDIWIVNINKFWKFNYIKIILRENNEYIENIILESKSLSLLQVKQYAINDFKNIDYGLMDLVSEIETVYSAKEDDCDHITNLRKSYSMSKFNEEIVSLHDSLS
jgi:hypothetical protein